MDKHLVPLNLPPHPFNIIKKESGLYILDGLRKKELLLTPEEWVRQHFIQYLISDKKVPKGLIALESGLKYNGMQKRSDILVAAPGGHVCLVVECKAPGVKLTQSVFNQAAAYNTYYNALWLAVTNGIHHVYARVNRDTHSVVHYAELPEYQQLHVS